MLNHKPQFSLSSSSCSSSSDQSIHQQQMTLHRQSKSKLLHLKGVWHCVCNHFGMLDQVAMQIAGICVQL